MLATCVRRNRVCGGVRMTPRTHRLPRSRANACARPLRARSSPAFAFVAVSGADARRRRLVGGDATLLSSHAASQTGGERHNEAQAGPAADSMGMSQLAAGLTL